MCPSEPAGQGGAPPVVQLHGVGLRYGARVALEGVNLALPAGAVSGFIGPDGVGKSSLLALVAGARAVQTGRVEVLGGDMADAGHRWRSCPRIAYLPQGLGGNLYATLSVGENLAFFGRLFGCPAQALPGRIGALTRATGLGPFLDRPVGQLSGGMRQKLGLCCALIHDPDLLVLDEPTTGVDPLARRQFWHLVAGLRARRPDMSVLVATAYMEEAARFDSLVAMDAGRVLACDRPAALLARTGRDTLEAAFIALLPPARRRTHRPVDIAPLTAEGTLDCAVEAEALCRRFGDFTAVDRVSLRIRRGEIFGFVGSNGCGKTTTMKMLTGLLAPTSGRVRLFGQALDPRQSAARYRVGYMSQFFSLYTELSVRQNLALHARLFGVPGGEREARVEAMLERLALREHADSLPEALPLGHRQRLSLAVALIHRPELLILDEPTSGVDPVARDDFWNLLGQLSREDGVTLFVSTHFMTEAERCDRVALMHEGRVLASGRPAGLLERCGAENLEAAFIALIAAAQPAAAPEGAGRPDGQGGGLSGEGGGLSREGGGLSGEGGGLGGLSGRRARPRRRFDPRRAGALAWREALELLRDPIRLTLALLGSALLMFVMGYGISMDVDDLRFAVLDRDRTPLSRDYVASLAASDYFTERPALSGYAELDRRMRAGELALALEIPPGFARDLARGRPVELGAWVDGAMPSRAETALGFVQGMHQHWLDGLAAGPADSATPARIEVRFRYNPNVESLVAMVPAVIPILLMMIPAMLAALSVVREKELGSIVNFHVTPTTRLEFLLGKQLPYVALSMLSFLLLVLLAVTAFDVPLEGSFAALGLGALLYVGVSTAMGLVISSFMRSQIAAIFGTAVLTILPAVSFSGLVDPVSSLQGPARAIGEVYPTTHFLVIARGTFSKALEFGDVAARLWPLVVAQVLLLSLAVLLLRKQSS